MTLLTEFALEMKRPHFAWFGALLLAISILVLPPIPIQAAPHEHLVQVQASSFSFNPGIIRVNPGDRVTIELTSTDVVHGMYIDGYDLNLTADPGQTARLTFTANRSGVFRLHCSVTCGALHPFMIGKLQVGPNWLLWKTALLAVMAVLAGSLSLSISRTRIEQYPR